MDFKTRIRNDDLDGVSEWVWPVEDDGLWLGPADDWRNIKPVILESCSSFENVAQAGGGCGMYPRLLSNIFEYVYTFEPDPYNFYCLTQNCQSQKIYKFNCALGHESRKVVFHAPHSSNRGTGTVYDQINDENRDKLRGDAVMMKLDSLEFSSLGLIYFDIENSEIYALRGSINTIMKHRPLIICESAGELVTHFLAGMGYSVISRHGADTVFKG